MLPPSLSPPPLRGRGPRHACIAVAATTLAWLGLLVGGPTAAQPPLGAAAAQPPSSDATAQAPAAAPEELTLARRIRAVEAWGRARPEPAVDALRALAAHAEPASAERLEALLVQGMLLADLVDAAGVEYVAGELESWPEGSLRAQAQACARLVRAALTGRAGHLLRADRWSDDALARLPGDAPVEMRLRFLTAGSDIKERSGRLEDAVRLGIESLALADRTGEDWRRASARVGLATSYFHAGQREAARRLNDEGVAIATAAGDELGLARALNNRSILLDGSHDLEGERVAVEGAIEHARRAGADGDEALFRANLADIYLKRGDFPTALRLSEEALPRMRALKDVNGETLALANMGLALVSMKRFAEGRARLEESIGIDERRGDLVSVQSTLGEMGLYLEQAGDVQGAVDAFHRARRLDDELLQRDQQRAIVEMQEQYDHERRGRELELLHRDNLIASEQLRQRELQQRVWALAAATAVLALALLGLTLQRLRRSNRRLQVRNTRLRVASERDVLTGLANRRHVQSELAERSPQQGFDGTLFLIDIDAFKQVNDRHGHAAGDAVLVEIARRLRLALRADDLLARWGGEEFLVIARGLVPDSIEALAQRMLDEIGGRAITLPGDVELAVTASIGFATFPLEPNALPLSWDDAIDLVDTAMYLAKAHGRNRAYGVRLLIASDRDELLGIARELEDAWRSGRVALTLLQGPTGGEVTT